MHVVSYSTVFRGSKLLQETFTKVIGRPAAANLGTSWLKLLGVLVIY